MNMVLKKIFRASVFLLAAMWMWVGADIVHASESDGKEISVRQNADEGSASKRTADDEHKEYVVAKDGSGDFRTIQEAVDNAEDGDTISIRPGVYYESVWVLEKELDITGSGKDECMILYDTASYLAVPLTMAAGTVSDLTIYGAYIRDGGLLQEEVDRVVSRYGEETGMKYLKLFQGFSGYAVHADQNFSYGRELRFENCRIISANNACVGIGSRGGEKIIFEGCELWSKGIQPCVYLHDCPLPEMGGETHFAMYDCLLQMESPEQILRFDSILDCNNYVFDFRDVRASVPGSVYDHSIVQVNNYSENTKDGWCGLNNTMLIPDSEGNTIDIMNWDAGRMSDYEKVQLAFAEQYVTNL